METLAARIDRAGPLETGEAVILAARLARALEGPHERGIAHGAVSPDSVLVDRDDLLTAVLRASSRSVPSLHHLSPERLGGGAPTADDDVWALGSTLYVALTGTVPFPGEKAEDVAARIQQGSIAPLAVFDAGDDDLQDLLEGIFHPKGDERTRSSTRVRKSLTRWLAKRGIAPGPALEIGQAESNPKVDLSSIPPPPRLPDTEDRPTIPRVRTASDVLYTFADEDTTLPRDTGPDSLSPPSNSRNQDAPLSSRLPPTSELLARAKAAPSKAPAPPVRSMSSSPGQLRPSELATRLRLPSIPPSGPRLNPPRAALDRIAKASDAPPPMAAQSPSIPRLDPLPVVPLSSFEVEAKADSARLALTATPPPSVAVDSLPDSKRSAGPPPLPIESPPSSAKPPPLPDEPPPSSAKPPPLPIETPSSSAKPPPLPDEPPPSSAKPPPLPVEPPPPSSAKPPPLPKEPPPPSSGKGASIRAASAATAENSLPLADSQRPDSSRPPTEAQAGVERPSEDREPKPRVDSKRSKSRPPASGAALDDAERKATASAVGASSKPTAKPKSRLLPMAIVIVVAVGVVATFKMLSGNNPVAPTEGSAQPTSVTSAASASASSAPPSVDPTQSAPTRSVSSSSEAVAPVSVGDASQCIAKLFPTDSFAEGAHPTLDFVCRETDPRAGAEKIHEALVIAGMGRTVSDGMREWAVMGWYELAAYATLRGRCCPEAPPVELPVSPGTCGSMQDALNHIAKSARLGGRDDEQRDAVAEFRKSLSCTLKSGKSKPYGSYPKPAGGEDTAFSKTLQRTRNP